MAANTATLTRAEQVERFVHYDALDLLVESIFQAWPDLFTLSPLVGEAGEVNLTGELAEQLWPHDDETGVRPQGWYAAEMRTLAFRASIFATLATDDGRDFCATEAARLAQRIVRLNDESEGDDDA
jgi:hypothetical protein